jgi:hypothetical protein
MMEWRLRDLCCLSEAQRSYLVLRRASAHAKIRCLRPASAVSMDFICRHEPVGGIVPKALG